jgi:hypothetical protein
LELGAWTGGIWSQSAWTGRRRDQRGEKGRRSARGGRERERGRSGGRAWEKPRLSARLLEEIERGRSRPAAVAHSIHTNADRNESFLPNGVSVVSSSLVARVDVVPWGRNDFFILHSLPSLILLPHQQNGELSRQLIDIKTIIITPLGLPLYSQGVQHCLAKPCYTRHLVVVVY